MNEWMNSFRNPVEFLLVRRAFTAIRYFGLHAVKAFKNFFKDSGFVLGS